MQRGLVEHQGDGGQSGRIVSGCHRPAVPAYEHQLQVGSRSSLARYRRTGTSPYVIHQ